MKKTKVCNACKKRKRIEGNFFVYKNGWVHSYCYPCNTAKTAAWAKRNPDKAKNIWRASNLKRKSQRAEWRANKRRLVIEALGGKCVHCGFSDARALHIDHKNGGGHREIKEMKGVQKLYRKILRGEIKGYQLLCANCNWIKRVELQEYRKK